MTHQVLLGMATSLLLAAAPPEKVTSGSDSEKLQGTWLLVSVEINKQPIPLEDLKSGKTVVTAQLVVKGESYLFTLGEERLEMTFKMDPTKTPKAIDMTIVAGPEKGKVHHGIYKLEGDTFTICRYFEPDKDRPTEFGTKPDSGLMLVVWKHCKP
jgi:uncharacterized protein (TIGR03067 family)